MEPVKVPKEVLEAYAGRPLTAAAPKGVPGVKDAYGMINDNGYNFLIRLNPEDLVLINMTGSMWLIFKSNFIPVFDIRPGDINLLPETQDTTEYLEFRATYELAEEARNNWELFVKKPSTVYMKQVPQDFKVETNEGLVTAKAYDWIAHDAATGHFWPIADSYKEIHYTQPEQTQPDENSTKALPDLSLET